MPIQAGPRPPSPHRYAVLCGAIQRSATMHAAHLCWCEAKQSSLLEIRSIKHWSAVCFIDTSVSFHTKAYRCADASRPVIFLKHRIEAPANWWQLLHSSRLFSTDVSVSLCPARGGEVCRVSSTPVCVSPHRQSNIASVSSQGGARRCEAHAAFRLG
jgi:hypothetical protein